MRVYCGIIAYNEEWIIEASLKSVYDYVDKIIVIDGSYWGPSTDKTVDIARSVGSKVEVISGTWRVKGMDHKYEQRMQYLNRMPKNSKDWCILHDADEIWDGENLGRLIDYLRYADNRTMLFSYQWLHLFGDCWHSIHGGSWDKPRKVGTFRLVPEVTYFNHHMVGVHHGVGNFQKLGSPGHITLKDVMFYHYGQAASKEKMEFKSYYYFFRDKGFRRGYKSWKEYRKNIFLPHWEKRMQQPNVVPYDGPHSEAIQPLIGTFWKKENEKTHSN